MPGPGSGKHPKISGAALLAFHQDQLTPGHSNEIKQLMRCVLQHHLGQRQLKSRELFRVPAGQA